jgi:hypothetical protein
VPQLLVGSDHGAFAPAGYQAFLRHCWTLSLLANHSQTKSSILTLPFDGKGVGASRADYDMTLRQCDIRLPCSQASRYDDPANLLRPLD